MDWAADGNVVYELLKTIQSSDLFMDMGDLECRVEKGISYVILQYSCIAEYQITWEIPASNNGV